MAGSLFLPQNSKQQKFRKDQKHIFIFTLIKTKPPVVYHLLLVLCWEQGASLPLPGPSSTQCT